MGCAPSIKLIIIRTNSKGELLNKFPSTFVNPSRGLKKATVSEIPQSLEYGRRLFVIFATNEYRHFPSLQHPIRESKLIASAFEDRSFESRVYENFTKRQFGEKYNVRRKLLKNTYYMAARLRNAVRVH